MNANMKNVNYFQDMNLQAIQLFYKRKDISAIIILPNDIFEFVTNFSEKKLSAIISSFKRENVELSLPKFKIENSLKLNDVLQQLGMIKAFGGADFSEITKKSPIFVNEVHQKAFVNVNETGTEAAAVTSISMLSKCKELKPPKYIGMEVNRPFLFLIKSESIDTCMFMIKIEEL